MLEGRLRRCSGLFDSSVVLDGVVCLGLSAITSDQHQQKYPAGARHRCLGPAVSASVGSRPRKIFPGAGYGRCCHNGPLAVLSAMRSPTWSKSKNVWPTHISFFCEGLINILGFLGQQIPSTRFEESREEKAFRAYPFGRPRVPDCSLVVFA